jgi:TrmH family RNA methyltransferase
MEIKVYKKEDTYSYSLGAFPTLELLNKHIKDVIDIYVHSSFNNKEVKEKILAKLGKNFKTNDKLIEKLSPKENCYIVGIFRKYQDILDKNENHLLLDNPSNMGNLGTIIRSSLGFGIKNIAIIKPGVDYFDPKTIRASMGSIFNINIQYFSSIDEYKNQFKDHTIYAFMLKATNTLQTFKFKKGLSTLAFGNEATGLSDSYLDNNSIIIKHSNEIDSLNITNAVSIALYEFNRQNN